MLFNNYYGNQLFWFGSDQAIAIGWQDKMLQTASARSQKSRNTIYLSRRKRPPEADVLQMHPCSKTLQTISTNLLQQSQKSGHGLGKSNYKPCVLKLREQCNNSRQRVALT